MAIAQPKPHPYTAATADLIDQLERTDLAVRCLLRAIDVAAAMPEHGAEILRTTAEGARRRLAMGGIHGA